MHSRAPALVAEMEICSGERTARHNNFFRFGALALGSSLDWVGLVAGAAVILALKTYATGQRQLLTQVRTQVLGCF